MAIDGYTIRAGVGSGPVRQFTIHPSSVERFTIDFTDVLDSGETVGSPTWSKVPTGATLTLLDASTSSPNATIKAHLGADGENVTVQCLAPLSGGQGRSFVVQFCIHVRSSL